MRTDTLEWVRFVALTALGLAIFPWLFKFVGGYSGLATQIMIVSLAAIGFNVLLGYGGLLSFGHAAYYGLGGYIAGLFLLRVVHDNPNLWLALLAAVIGVGIISFVIGLLVVRLYGVYFALLTLAFAQMFYFIVFEWRDVTRGDDGLQGIPSPSLSIGPWHITLNDKLPAFDLGPFGDLSDVKWWYVFTAALVLLALVFTRALVRSQFGEVLRAIRENEQRSTFLGFNPSWYKLAAFTISGTLAGLSGALRAIYEQYAAIDMLTIAMSSNFIVYTIIGGIQTIFGPVLGTALIMYLQDLLSRKFDWWRLIIGIVFVIVVIFLQYGILGTLARRRRERSVAPA